MKPTPFASIVSWISKIHQPLPRTPRQSQQLLNMLSQSFERQLDKVHPPVLGSPEQHEHIPEKDVAGSSRPTDHHFDALLQHSIFSTTERNGGKVGSSRLDARTRLEDAFQHNIATADLIARCLEANENQSMHDPQLGNQEQSNMSRDSIVPRIAELITDSSLPTRRRIFAHRGLMKDLARRLVDEGHYSTAWAWLKEIISGSLILSSDGSLLKGEISSFTKAGRAMLNVIISRLASQGKLHLAIDEYLIPLCRADKSGKATDTNLTNMHLTILRSGMRKTFTIIVLRGGFDGSPPKLFGDVLKHSSLLNQGPHTAEFYRQALLLYHPSSRRASASAFCRLSADSTPEKQPMVSYFADSYSPFFAMSLIDRAETLLAQGDNKQGLAELAQSLIRMANARSESSQPLQEHARQRQEHPTNPLNATFSAWVSPVRALDAC
ncbi:MAG: hypothetical protein Q9160_007443 [Pyrenula sp. 1 TL-2023]